MKWATLLVSLPLLLETAAAIPMQSRGRVRGLPAYYNAFQAKDDQGRFSRVVLRNGLTIVLEENTIRPLLAVATYVRLGKDEGPPAKLAAAAASLARISDLDGQIRKLGGFLTTRAGDGYVAFLSLTPSDNMAATIQAHALLTRAPAADEGDLPERPAAEVPVSPLEEALWRLSSKTGGAGDSAPAAEPPGAGGSAAAESVSAKAFQQAHFAPGDIIVAVSGSILRERVFEQVVGQYGKLKKKAASPPSRAAGVEAPAAFEYLQLRGQTETTRLLLASPAPERGHPDYYPLLALATILGGGRGSLLARHLEGAGVAVDSEAELVQRDGKGWFRLQATPTSGKLDAAEVRILSLIQTLSDKELVAPELERAKALLVRAAYQGIEAVEDRALRLARGEALGNYLEMEQEPGKILELTAEQVAATAAKYLSETSLSLLESLPAAGEERNFTTESLLETLHLLIPADLGKVRQEIQSSQVASGEPVALPESFKPSFLSDELKRTSVLRGPDIFLEEEHVVPLVDLAILFPGGRIDETSENAGVTELSLRALLASLESKEGAAVWLDLERSGAQVKLVNEPDFFGLQASLLSANLPVLLPRLLKWLEQPEFTESAFALAKQALVQEAARMRENRLREALGEVSAELFKDHPYGRSRFGSDTSVAGLDLEKTRQWTKSQIDGFHPTILIRGDVAGTSFLPDLISVLSNSKLHRKARVRKEVHESARSGAASVDKESGFFLLGVPGPARGARDEWLLDVVESLVYLLGDRLPSDDPSPRPYHGLELSHLALDSGGALFFRATAEPGKMEAAMTAARRDLGRLSQAPVRETDVLNALVVTITRLYASQQRGESYLPRLASELIGGEKTGFREEYLTTVKGARAEDLRGVAGRYFPGDPPTSPERAKQEQP